MVLANLVVFLLVQVIVVQIQFFQQSHLLVVAVVLKLIRSVQMVALAEAVAQAVVL